MPTKDRIAHEKRQKRLKAAWRVIDDPKSTSEEVFKADRMIARVNREAQDALPATDKQPAPEEVLILSDGTRLTHSRRLGTIFDPDEAVANRVMDELWATMYPDDPNPTPYSQRTTEDTQNG